MHFPRLDNLPGVSNFTYHLPYIVMTMSCIMHITMTWPCKMQLSECCYIDNLNQYYIFERTACK